MKLITIWILSIIYVAGVKAAALGPQGDGYNYEKPEQAFEQQAVAEEVIPVEAVVERLGSPEIELAVDNTIDAEVENQANVADDIDLRYQEEAIDSNVENQANGEVETQNAEKIAVVEQEETQPQVEESVANEPVVEETAAVEETEPEQIAVEVSESNVENEEVQQAASEAAQDEAEIQVAAEQTENEAAPDESQSLIPQVEEEVAPSIPNEVETRLNVENLSEVHQEAENYESHAADGYNYEQPKATFTLPEPLPEQLAVEASFVHQDLGSEHKAEHKAHHGKRLKLKGPVPSCGGRDWRQVVIDRSQKRPNNRRTIPYTEEITDASYFEQ